MTEILLFLVGVPCGLLLLSFIIPIKTYEEGFFKGTQAGFKAKKKKMKDGKTAYIINALHDEESEE
tara:strand:+ start:42 stop:239 length:198 start_codon:yes stop_codon:yes gene_type:complete